MLADVEAMPIHALRFGAADPTLAALLVTGGVHGLERIGTTSRSRFSRRSSRASSGTRCCTSCSRACASSSCRCVNPVGMARGSRANGSGVDLMRNAPAASLRWHAARRRPALLVAAALVHGRRRARWSPNRRPCVRLVERELFASPLAIAARPALGLRPHRSALVSVRAHARAAARSRPRSTRSSALLDDDAAEPRLSRSSRPRASTRSAATSGTTSTIAGAARAAASLISLTLEMGSWSWVRKNPLQGLSSARPVQPDHAAPPSPHAAPPPAAARLPAPRDRVVPALAALAEAAGDVVLGPLVDGAREQHAGRCVLDEDARVFVDAEERGVIADACGLLHVVRDDHDRVRRLAARASDLRCARLRSDRARCTARPSARPRARRRSCARCTGAAAGRPIARAPTCASDL